MLYVVLSLLCLPSPAYIEFAVPAPNNLKTFLQLLLFWFGFVCLFHKIYYHKFSKLILCEVSFIYPLFIDNSDLSCEYNILVPQGQIPASIGASLTKDEEFIEPGKSLCASPSCSPFIINGNKDTLNKAGMLDSYPDKLHF